MVVAVVVDYHKGGVVLLHEALAEHAGVEHLLEGGNHHAEGRLHRPFGRLDDAHPFGFHPHLLAVDCGFSAAVLLVDTRLRLGVDAQRLLLLSDRVGIAIVLLRGLAPGEEEECSGCYKCGFDIHNSKVFCKNTKNMIAEADF